MTRPVALFVIALAALALVSGCSRFKRENFAMIREGVDDREDVEQILGKPKAKMDDVWFYDNVDKHVSAQIVFGEDGRVISKEWMNARTGTWEGRHAKTDEPPQGEVRERETRTRRFDD